MSTTTIVEPKPSKREKAATFWKTHERKFLIATTVISTGTAIAMRTGIAQHNAFLKEHGLYDQFYGIESTVEA